MALITAMQVAEELGVSPKTVYDWAELRKIPSYKLGKCLRFKLQEVEQWVEKNRIEPHKKIAA